MRTLIKAVIRIAIVLASLQVLIFLGKSLVSFLSVPESIRESAGPTAYYGLGLILGITLISALLLYFLWRKSDWLVGVFAGNFNENELIISSSNLDLVTVVMRVVGICLVITSLPSLLGLAIYHARIVQTFHGVITLDEATQANELQQWITVIGTILAGLWLVLGGRGIAEAVDKKFSAVPTSSEDNVKK
jgi:hypothetical protein